jgi:hypothetical protein
MDALPRDWNVRQCYEAAIETARSRHIRIRSFLRSCIFLIAATLTHGQVNAQATANLVGAWQLNEGIGTTTADSSSSGKTGTLVNSPAWTTGHTGSALTFNAPNEYVAVDGGGTLANLHTSGLTVAAWIKPASATGRIVDKNNDDYGGWFFKLESDGTLQFVSNAFEAAPALRSSGDAIDMGTWQHVAATWDGSATGSHIHLYINGVLSDGAGSNGSGTIHTDSTTPFAIGNRPVDAARGFDGNIDDVQVFDRALTATEIQGLVNVDTTAPTTPGALSAVASNHIPNQSELDSFDR